MAWIAFFSADRIEAQQVRGRAVDEPNRQGIPEVLISAVDSSGAVVAQSVTGSDGFFQIALSSGTFRLAAERIGFVPDTQRVIVRPGASMNVPAFVLVPFAVELDSIVVERQAEPENATVGFSRVSHVVAGVRMALLEEQGARVITAAGEIGGLKIRPLPRGYCVESRRKLTPMQGAPSCDMVVVVIDGIPVPNAQEIFAMSITDAESVEYLTPVEAGFRYGMEASAKGALVIWTRGRGPHTSGARNRQF